MRASLYGLSVSCFLMPEMRKRGSAKKNSKNAYFLYGSQIIQ
nr:MAG TPA: hypothetical protein [Caudoviricetes sp.]